MKGLQGSHSTSSEHRKGSLRGLKIISPHNFVSLELHHSVFHTVHIFFPIITSADGRAFYFTQEMKVIRGEILHAPPPHLPASVPLYFAFPFEVHCPCPWVSSDSSSVLQMLPPLAYLRTLPAILLSPDHQFPIHYWIFSVGAVISYIYERTPF